MRTVASERGEHWPARMMVACAVVLFAATLVAELTASPARTGSAVAYVEGAPAGFSGGFKEDSCLACHFGADVNSKPGEVTIAGVPERYVAGERYTLVVTLLRPGMKRGGFQLSTRFKNGAQAGAISAAPGDKRVGIDSASAIQYANQRQAGPVTSDTISWSIVWTAPKSGLVIVDVAANAANGDEVAGGDFVYTASKTSTPRPD